MSPYEKIAVWGWFWLAQVLMLITAILGWFVLIMPCLLEAWEPSTIASINADRRQIDRWSWPWLNGLYGNPEDGVSGQTALVWVNATSRGPYMPFAWAPWRAWVWSAWRNSTDSLKYSLALGLRGPIMKPRTLFGRTLTGGWSVENGLSVLVLGFKRTQQQ